MSKTISLIPIALGLFTGLAFAAQPGNDPRLSNPAESRIAPASSETGAFVLLASRRGFEPL